MLSTENEKLLQAVSCALFGGTVEPDWHEYYSAAKAQAIIPLVCPDSPDAAHYYAHYIRILYAQDELLHLMRSVNIPVSILKGAAAAIYYPDPFRRTMGDIDVIVSQDQFQTASDLMAGNGYRLTGDLDVTDRHRSYDKDGITVELHHHYSFEGIDVEEYVIEGIKHLETAMLGGHPIPVLPPVENGIVLLAHVASHLRSGLGLRQMIDWMMYVHAQITDEYWETVFRAVAIDCGLEKLAITSTRLCQKYLGLPDPITWCDGADDKLVDDLLENLLITGNFGHAHGSGSSVETVTTNIKRTGLFRYLQQQGEHNWKAYQNHKALKPFCWAYQIGRYIHRGFGTGRCGAQLVADYKRSNSRYELLTRLGID